MFSGQLNQKGRKDRALLGVDQEVTNEVVRDTDLGRERDITTPVVSEVAVTAETDTAGRPSPAPCYVMWTVTTYQNNICNSLISVLCIYCLPTLVLVQGPF